MKFTLFQLQILLLIFTICGNPLDATELKVAVASNFQLPAEQIKKYFELESTDQLKLITGSSGKHFAQIVNGAPFDIFLAADSSYITKLQDLHLIEQGTKIQYAKGKLVLVVKPNKNNDSQLLKKLFLENQLFTNERFKKLIINHFAIANPDLAPYGRAAKEVLEKLGVFSILKEKLVMGENIQQTQQLVTTGNAEFALLSLAQVVNTSEVYFIVPEKLFSPIVQEAVVLKSDLSKLKAAKDFLDFLKLDKIKTLIREFGYDTL